MANDRPTQLVEAGLLLQMSGDDAGARKVWEEAVRLDPGNERARQCLAEAQPPRTFELAPPSNEPAPGRPAAPRPPPAMPTMAFARPGSSEPVPEEAASDVDLSASEEEEELPGAHDQTRVVDMRNDPRLRAMLASSGAQEGSDTLMMFQGAPTPGAEEPTSPNEPTRIAAVPTDPRQGEPYNIDLEMEAVAPALPPPLPAAALVPAGGSRPAGAQGLLAEARRKGTPPPFAPEARPLARPPQFQPSESIPALLKGAQDLLDLDDHTGAHETLMKALSVEPGNARAQQMLERCESTLLGMWESKIGDVFRRPKVLLRPDEVVWLSLDHRAGFVLSLIDGTINFDDLYALSSMSHFDTSHILVQLLSSKVIA